MKLFIVAILTALSQSSLLAQEIEDGGQINEIPFESVPGDSLIQGAGGIGLESDVAVSGNLAVQGVVESAAGGFLFPDGSLQTTAVGAPEGFSANSGLYANRIADFVPSQPFSEICFKNGQVFGDVHVNSETTRGGNCLPGDLGWVVERNQRTAANWEDARIQCLLTGMRLPELFEFIYSCDRAGSFGLNSMNDDWEWAGNSAQAMRINTNNGAVVATSGGSGCSFSGPGWIGTTASGFGDLLTYRCLR